MLPFNFWHLKIHREKEIEWHQQWCLLHRLSAPSGEHSFPTKTTAAIELLNVTKQVPERLTMAFIQPFSSLATQANIYALHNRELLIQPSQSASVKTHT